MNTFQLGLVLLHCVVLLQLSGCVSQDESVNHAVTAGKLQHTPSETHPPDNDTVMDEHLLDNYEDYIYEEDQDNYPRVAFSVKPKDSSVTTMKGQGKGRDKKKKKKKNPCLSEKYRNYCVHGTCRYLVELNHTSCVCEVGYTGDRCHLFILPVGKEDESNGHTTALAVTAAVLSLMCFTVIGILLAFRCQNKGDGNMDEKVRLEPLQSTEEKAKDLNQWLCGHDGYHLETSCQC